MIQNLSLFKIAHILGKKINLSYALVLLFLQVSSLLHINFSCFAIITDFIVHKVLTTVSIRSFLLTYEVRIICSPAV
jgi:hypothetical protein